MADTFQLEVATPERLFVDEQVTEAELPAQNGYIGVLAGHAPLLSALGAGVLSFKTGSGERVLAIDGGFVEIYDNHVRVLADRAEFGNDIDASAARRQLDEANAQLKSVHEKDSDAVLQAVARAQARVDAAEKAGRRAA
ncbi:MAG: ATP synthase F1 subunit epsilon [Acidobacteriaceae bacterium]|nr:ATP synthase F1 subunit epsilon [Acidobacteriaceae bacterium]MBV8569402.1 ATP synthase F1 subunit epsilon [Acidobacteriaceae bacterium]